jgi:pilus assembly protein Flp/PilA
LLSIGKCSPPIRNRLFENTVVFALNLALSSALVTYPHLMNTIRKFLQDESGATAIEYGLIAAGIALAIIAAVNGLGGKVNSKFTSINSSLK